MPNAVRSLQHAPLTRQLESVLKNLHERLTKLVTEMRDFQTKYNIRVLKPGEAEAMRRQQAAAAAGGAAEGKSTGVLA